MSIPPFYSGATGSLVSHAGRVVMGGPVFGNSFPRFGADAGEPDKAPDKAKDTAAQSSPLENGKASAEPSAERGKSWRAKTWNAIVRVAPLSNLLGGLMLIGSSFLPQPPVTPPVATPSEPHPIARQADDAPSGSVPTPESAVSASQAKLDAQLADWRQTLERLGWVLFSAGGFAGKVNVIGTGFNKNQPAMALGGLWGMGTAVALVFDPTVPLRIAFLTASAMLINGFGNMVQNEYRLKSGEKPREFDMSPFYSREARQKLVAAGSENSGEPPTAGDALKAWAKYLAGMGRFVAEDHVTMARKTGEAMRFTVLHPAQSAGKVKENAVQLAHYLGRRSKDQPDFIQPGATQNQLGSMLIYAGGIPWLLLNGEVPEVERTLQSLMAAGSLVADLSLVGVGGAEKGINRAVALGPLLINGGTPWIETNAGAGVGMIGNAFVDNYFANQATDQAEQPLQTEHAEEQTIQKETEQKEVEHTETGQDQSDTGDA